MCAHLHIKLLWLWISLGVVVLRNNLDVCHVGSGGCCVVFIPRESEQVKPYPSDFPSKPTDAAAVAAWCTANKVGMVVVGSVVGRFAFKQCSPLPFFLQNGVQRLANTPG
jgi:hypothetical protein